MILQKGAKIGMCKQVRKERDLHFQAYKKLAETAVNRIIFYVIKDTTEVLSYSLLIKIRDEIPGNSYCTLTVSKTDLN